MNLVTDQYITTSFEDFNEKGYEGKLLGFITMQFILFLIFLFRIWIDSQNLQFLFMKVSLINGALFGLGFSEEHAQNFVSRAYLLNRGADFLDRFVVFAKKYG